MIESSARSEGSIAPWYVRYMNWCYVVAFGGLQAIVQFPLWKSTLPVLSDYPNHLARMYILSQGGRSAILNRFYEIHWAALPNLAMDIVVPPLVPWLGVDTAGRVFLSLTLLLISSGTLALFYALHRRLSPWPFTVFLFLYNQIFLDGVVNYLFGLGVALWVMAAWIVCRKRSYWWRFPVFSLAAIVLFFFHLSTFCTYAIFVVAYEAGNGGNRRLRAFPWLHVAQAAVTVALPILIFLALSPVGQGEGQAFNWQKLSFAGYLAAMFAAKLLAPLVPVANYVSWLDAVTLGILGALLIRGIFSRVLVVEHSMQWPLFAIGLAFLLTPPVLFKSNMADTRLVMVWVLLFIAGADLTVIKPVMRWMVLTTLAALFVIRTGVIVSVWSTQDKLVLAYRLALDRLPAGSSVFTAFPEQLYSDAIGSFKMYLPCLSIVSRSTFVPSLYSLRGGQPIWLTPKFRSLKKLSGGPMFPQGQSPDWGQIIKNYDYLLVAGQTYFAPLPFAKLEPVANGPDFTLYRVR